MKKLSLLILFVFISISGVLACPFCGCGNSNFQLGLLPSYSKAFVGVRYTYTHFNTLSTDGTQFSHDYFHATELWGGYKIGKVQIMAFVPYLTSHKLSDDGDINSRGLGDILILSNYQILSVAHTNATGQVSYSNSLWLGGGIKLKTGKSYVDTGDPAFTVGDFSSTPGTGSTDFMLNATHNFIVGNSGLVTNAAYRINTANTQQFQYGNRFYFNTAYFHTWPVGSLNIRPSAGFNLVLNGTNHYEGQAVTGSKGYILSGTAGINLQRGKLGLMANGFLPVSQDLFNGQTKLQVRGSLALTFSF